MKPFSKSFRITLTIISMFTIAIMSIMDLNATHMTNPLWPAHARFHWAIQYFSAIAVNIIGLFMLWGTYKERGGNLSVLFIGLNPLLFWAMFFPALLMPGTGTWPDGVVPPSGFPELFKTIHPNLIMATVITILAPILTIRELRKQTENPK
jgi:uncharacterized membrane protein